MSEHRRHIQLSARAAVAVILLLIAFASLAMIRDHGPPSGTLAQISVPATAG